MQEYDIRDYDPLTPFQELQRSCWQVAEDHGWHVFKGESPWGTDVPYDVTNDWQARFIFLEKHDLIHAELSEALEEFRDGHGFNETYRSYSNTGDKPEGIPVELADVAIRLFDLCETFGIDLEAAIAEKQEYNKTRSYRHGGKAA